MPATSQFHVDHIISTSRWSDFRDGSLSIESDGSERGPNHLDNFAWSCPFCNGFKGSTVSGKIGGRAYSLFHPRRDTWDEHFVLTDRSLLILGLTVIGEVTERLLRFNDSRPNGPLAVRHAAIVDGIYPPAWARAWSV